MIKINVQELFPKISPAINKIQSSKLSNGISGGMMTGMPIILVGAFAALLLNLPIPGWKSFVAGSGFGNVLNIAINFSTNFLAVVFVVSISYCYAKQFNEDGIIPSTFALVCFFIITPFTKGKDATVIPMQWLGSSGIFSAIIVSLLSTRIYIYMKQHGFTIKMPESVPPVVLNSFKGLIPGFSSIIIFLIISGLFSITPFKTMHQFIYSFVQIPLQGIGGNIVSVIIVWTFAQVLWFFGIHGTLVIYSVILPIFTAMDIAQITAYAAGQPLPNIVGRAFCSTYTMSASAIGFTLLMLFASKSKQYKTIGKLTALPAIFGISEPLVFGTPLVFNFRFAVPFIFMNAINLLLAYILTAIGLVPRVAGVPPISGMPIILSGLIQGSWKIAVVQIVGVLLSIIVWYPFFRKADRDAYEIEQKMEVKEDCSVS